MLFSKRCSAVLGGDEGVKFGDGNIGEAAAGDLPFVVASMTAAVAGRRNVAGLGGSPRHLRGA